MVIEIASATSANRLIFKQSESVILFLWSQSLYEASKLSYWGNSPWLGTPGLVSVKAHKEFIWRHNKRSTVMYHVWEQFLTLFVEHSACEYLLYNPNGSVVSETLEGKAG